MPHLGPLRECSRLLCLEALVEADQGNADAAARSLLCAFALARSLSTEPIRISHLVKARCNWRSVDVLERVFAQVMPEEARLAALSDALRKADRPGATAWTMAAERCSAA